MDKDMNMDSLHSYHSAEEALASSSPEFPNQEHQILSWNVTDSQVESMAQVAATVRTSPAGPRVARPPAGTCMSEGKKLSRSDLGKIVDWLETQDNYAMLHGTNGRLSVGEKHPSKKTMFKLMLVTLHSKGFASFVTTGDNLGKRVSRYVTKWKEALTLKNSTGAGLTEQEARCGITMEEKYEKICPHFARMDALYGERSNVDPDALGCSGIRGQPEFYYESQAGDEQQAPANIESGYEHCEETQTEELGEEDMTQATNSDSEDATQNEPVETEQNTADTYLPGNVVNRNEPIPSASATPSASAARRTPTKRSFPSTSQGASKTNVTDLYLEKIAGKGEFRKQMIETKEKWATLEMADRREARALSAAQAADSAKNEREYAFENARIQREHDEKRAKMEHEHNLTVLKSQQSTSILNVILTGNRTEAEVSSLLKLVRGFTDSL